MKHFKLSKQLSLGQNLTVLVLILNVLVIFSPTHKAEAFFADLFKSSETVNACEKIEQDLSNKLSTMSEACSATDLGRGCLQSLFTCSNEDSDTSECESISTITSSPDKEGERQRLDEQKDDLEALEKAKIALQNKQEEAQKEVDKLNSNYEEKARELQAADEELQAELKSNKDNLSSQLAQIQTENKVLEEQNNALFGKLLDQKRQMIQFMTAERLVCSQKAKEEAQKFYTIMRTCMSGRGNCSISLNSFVRNGNRSLAQMSRDYERKQNRKCLRVDGSNNDFAIKYKALNAALKVDQIAIANQQALLEKNRAALTGQIVIAQATGELANSEAKLKHSQKIQLLSTEKARLQAQIDAKADSVKRYVAEVKSAQDQIDTQNSEIANTRRSLSSSMDGSKMNKLRESQIIAESLASDAEYAVANNKCPCTGSLKNISGLSGKSFCETSNDVESSDEEVFFENSTNVTAQ